MKNLVLFLLFVALAFPAAAQPQTETVVNVDSSLIGYTYSVPTKMVVQAGYIWFIVGGQGVFRVPVVGGGAEKVEAFPRGTYEFETNGTHFFYLADKGNTIFGSNGTIGTYSISTGKAKEIAGCLWFGPNGIVADSGGFYITQSGWIQTPNTGAVNKINFTLEKCNDADKTYMLREEAHPTSIAVDENFIWWTTAGYGVGNGSIRRLPKNGGEPETVVSGLDYPNRLEISNGELWWTELGGGHGKGKLRSMPLSGAPVTDVASNLNYPYAFVLDRNFAYVVETVSGSIRRIPKSGGAAETVASGLKYPVDVVADSNYIYFAEATGFRIGKALKTATDVSLQDQIRWDFAARYPHPGWYLSADSIGDKIYAFGGANISVFLDYAREYDSSADKWTMLPGMFKKKQSAGIAVLGKKIHILGGLGYEENVDHTQPVTLNGTEIYDTETRTWSRGPDLVEGVWDPAAVVFENKIYLFGGHDPSGGITNAVQIFDPAKNRWEYGKPMPGPRKQHAALLVDGKIWIIGGTDGRGGGSLIPDVSIYDPKAESWEQGDFLNFERGGFAAAVFGRTPVVAGGLSYASTTPTVEFYNRSAQKWQFTTPMPFSLGDGTSGVKTRGNFYVFGAVSTIPPLYGFNLMVAEIPDEIICQSQKPEDANWTACSAGQQSRTAWSCDTTDGEWKQKTETQACSVECRTEKPADISWGACSSAGLQDRTVYSCNNLTGEWKPKTETRACTPACADGTAYEKCSASKPKFCEDGKLVDKASECGCESGFAMENESCISLVQVSAEQALSDANTAIQKAVEEKRNVTEALGLLQQALGFAESEQWDAALQYAGAAKEAAENAPRGQEMPVEILAGAAAAAAAVAALAWRAGRRQKIPEAPAPQ